MATIIDSLVVRLGLDTGDLSAKSASVDKSLKTVEGSSKQTTDSVKQIGRASKETTSSLGDLARGFAAFSAAVGGATAVCVAFAKSTIDSSAALSRMSQNLGIGVQELSAWGNAVEGLGGSAKGLQGTMSMLSQAQTELRLTGQSSLVPYFSALGVAMSGVDGKGRPVNDMLLDLAGSFEKLDRASANNMGKMMGIDQDTLNLLLQGRHEVELEIKRQKEQNAVSKEQAEQSARLQKSIINLKQGFEALGRSLLGQASPAIETFLGILTRVSDWVRNNSEFIRDLATILGTVAAGLALIAIATSPITLTVTAVLALSAAIAALWQDYQTWKRGGDSLIDWEKWKPGIDAAKNSLKDLKDTLHDIADAIAIINKGIHGDTSGANTLSLKLHDKVMTQLGFNRNAAPIADSFKNLFRKDKDKTPIYAPGESMSTSAPVKLVKRSEQARETANGSTATQAYMKQYFIDRGWTPEQASGIAANLWAESGGKAKATGDSGKAFGLAQWHPDRQAAFKQYSGKDINESTVDDQLDFTNHELQTRAGRDLHKATTAAEAGAIVSKEYESPRDKDGQATLRAALAEEILKGSPSPQTPSVKELLDMAQQAYGAAKSTQTPPAVQSTMSRQLNGISGASTVADAAGSLPVNPVSASGGPTSNDNSVSVQTGPITINTAATDASGIAKDLVKSIHYGFTAQANSGLN